MSRDITTTEQSAPLSSSPFSHAAISSTFRHEVSIEKYKREIELLRQKLQLTEEQAAERQRMAVLLALHETQLNYSNAVEHMKAECERRLNEWRHNEAVRAKEKESAADEDRYSIRLEMKHALQRSQIDQRVASLQSQADYTMGPRDSVESDFSIGTLDEVLVRMQLEQVRTRRFDALKKALLIRHAKLNQAAKGLFCHWKIQASNTKILRLNAVLHMHRILLHFDARKKVSCFNKWRSQVQLVQVHAFQAQALLCWNRMIAVERISHIVDRTMVRSSGFLEVLSSTSHLTNITTMVPMQVKRTALCFHRWRYQTCAPSKDSGSTSGGNFDQVGIDDEVMQSLQQEIQKLHDQLSSSKSEAWRYKRQLLKQFL